MDKKFISHGLKLILICVGLLALYTGFSVLPDVLPLIMTTQPSFSAIAAPFGRVLQFLVLAFLLGLGAIIFLLHLFDINKAYSQSFVKGLNFLVGLCILASVLLVCIRLAFLIQGIEMGLLNLLLLISLFLILSVMAVILLIKCIVQDTMAYKEDVDLTI